MNGKIAKLTKKGFGFISREGGDDLFFHSNDLSGVSFDALNEGMEVEFEIGQSDKGPNAVNVSLASADSGDEQATEESEEMTDSEMTDDSDDEMSEEASE